MLAKVITAPSARAALMSVFTLVYPSCNVCTCRVEDDRFRYKLPFYNILEDGLYLKLAVLHLMLPLCKALLTKQYHDGCHSDGSQIVALCH